MDSKKTPKAKVLDGKTPKAKAFEESIRGSSFFGKKTFEAKVFFFKKNFNLDSNLVFLQKTKTSTRVFLQKTLASNAPTAPEYVSRLKFFFKKL